MLRDLLPHLPVVARVAARRSFAVAAAELGIGASAASHAVRLVERRLGVPLFARTTRSVAPTEAGAAFLARIVPALTELTDAIDAARAGSNGVAGTLRINAPHVAGPLGLTPVVAELLRRHPALVVDVTSDQSLVDIVADGFDVGVRIGERIAADMVAVRLTPPFRVILVASPDYLSRYGRPETLSDLAGHRCIAYRRASMGGLHQWELRDGDRDVTVAVDGPLHVGDPTLAYGMALAGAGIAYMMEPLARDDLASGRLIDVLPGAARDVDGLFLYFPRRSGDVPKIRALIQAARAVTNGAVLAASGRAPL